MNSFSKHYRSKLISKQASPQVQKETEKTLHFNDFLKLKMESKRKEMGLK